MSTGIYLEAENIRISIDKTKIGLWLQIRNIKCCVDMKLTFLCIHDLKWPHYYCCISTKNLMFPIPLFVRVLSAVNHILLWFICCCLKVDLKVKNQVKAPLQFTPHKCHIHNRIGKFKSLNMTIGRGVSTPLNLASYFITCICGQAISIFKTFFSTQSTQKLFLLTLFFLWIYVA